MESFMASTKFDNPIHMDVGPDGRLYVLEDGSGWFAKKPDAGLSRLDYNGGNRTPRLPASMKTKHRGLCHLLLLQQLMQKIRKKVL